MVYVIKSVLVPIYHLQVKLKRRTRRRKRRRNGRRIVARSSNLLVHGGEDEKFTALNVLRLSGRPSGKE
jgi:hypothetical protein